MDESIPRLLFRGITPADAPGVRALAASLRRWFSPRDLEQIDALLGAEHTGWVAVTERGEIEGFVLAAPTPEPHVQELAWMGVASSRQGQGIGTRLLEHLLADLRGRGCTVVEVSTVAESAGYAPYESTRAFYHARGFSDVRVDPDYYWPGGDRLVLRRAL